MSDDKIEEIRERYAGYSLNSGNAGKANEDRGWLLAEVDRLRAALKNIAALDPDVPDALVADALRGIVAQMGEIARKALEGKP